MSILSTKSRYYNNSTAVALVTTPLQFLNACEFAAKESLTYFHIHVIQTKYDAKYFKHLPRYEKITKVCYWDLWYVFVNSAPIFLHRILQLLQASFFKSKIEKAIKYPKIFAIGNINDPLMRHCANTIRCKRLVLLDDGFATINSVKKFSTFNFQNKKNRLYDIVVSCLRLRLQNPKIYELFSAFEVECEPIKIIKNEFIWLRKQIFAKVSSDQQIWIVGQPLIECRILTQEEYRLCLTEVIRYYPAKTKFKYLMHPGEKYAYQHQWMDSLGIRVVRNIEPIEIYLANCKYIPQRIAAFYSTAIINCKLLYGNNLEFDIFDITSLIPIRSKLVVESVYKYISGNLHPRDSIIKIERSCRRPA